MGDRHCLGCGTELTGEVITLEHSLPQWLAREIELPGVGLRHFMHDETKPEGLHSRRSRSGARSDCNLSCKVQYLEELKWLNPDRSTSTWPDNSHWMGLVGD